MWRLGPRLQSPHIPLPLLLPAPSPNWATQWVAHHTRHPKAPVLTRWTHVLPSTLRRNGLPVTRGGSVRYWTPAHMGFPRGDADPVRCSTPASILGGSLAQNLRTKRTVGPELPLGLSPETRSASPSSGPTSDEPSPHTLHASRRLVGDKRCATSFIAWLCVWFVAHTPSGAHQVGPQRREARICASVDPRCVHRSVGPTVFLGGFRMEPTSPDFGRACFCLLPWLA